MGKKILVVDDEKLIVKGIRFSLEQEGMEVDCAYDGEEALECARKCEYDLVLLDVMLPKLDGFEVCQQIREFSDMPIVMLTAKSEDMDKILGLEYGADDYITKPFNILEVKARIKAIMRRTSKRKEPAGSPVLVKGNMKIAALPTNGAIGGWGLMVSAYSEHKEEAAKFALYRSSYESQMKALEMVDQVPTLNVFYDPETVPAGY